MGKNLKQFVNPNQSMIPFTENPGIKKRNADAANTPLAHFLLFFTNDPKKLK